MTRNLPRDDWREVATKNMREIAQDKVERYNGLKDRLPIQRSIEMAEFIHTGLSTLTQRGRRPMRSVMVPWVFVGADPDVDLTVAALVSKVEAILYGKVNDG
jgi:hypothetical protein